MKKITSLTLGFSFLIMSITGIMLYIVPQGKIAYWADWHLLGLTKSQYGEIHTTSMVTFLGFGILHIYYNWKPIVSYMKDKSKKVSFTKKEFLIAFGLNLIFVVGTLFMVQPFKAFLDLQGYIKDGWAKEYGEPPYGHAEETKLKVFCKKINIDYEKASEILRAKNIKFTANETLLSISKNNNIPPSELYKLIKPKSVLSSSEDLSSPPSNLGRKTLQDLSDMKRIDLTKAIKILKSKGLSDVEASSKFKNLADDLEMNPLDLYNLLIK